MMVAGLTGYSPASTDPCRTTIIMNTSFQPLSQHQPHHQHQLQEQQQQQSLSHPPPPQQQQQQQQLQQQQQQQALRWAFPPHLAASSDYTGVVGTGGTITVSNGAYGSSSATADGLLATNSSSTQPAPSYASQAPRGMPRPTRHDVGPWSQEVRDTTDTRHLSTVRYPSAASLVLVG